VNGSAHLRGIVIAGVLAAVALALGFVTLAMNQTASNAAAPAITPLKLRHHAAATGTTTVAKTQVVKKKKHVVRVDPNLTAALKAGLPRSVARGLAAHKVAVIQLTSHRDQIAQLALGEARVGAGLAGAALVPVDVDGNGGAAFDAVWFIASVTKPSASATAARAPAITIPRRCALPVT
jgi:hypothetical protein